MKESENIVNESNAAYKLSALTPLEVVYAKGKLDSTKQRMTIIKTVRDGVTRVEFIKFLKDFDFSMKEMTEILPASYSSLTKLAVYDKDTSERILELSLLFKLGISVFGKKEKFTGWLRHQNSYLNGYTPFSLLDTSMGFSLVTEELYRIEYSFVA